MGFIEDIVRIYINYPDSLFTEVLVASVRSPSHVVEAAKIGSDVVTVPPSVLKALVSHPLTEKGLSSFLSDWEKTGQKII